MSDPVRWRAAEGGGPSGARELLLKAKAPKALGGAAKAQHAAMLAKVVAAGAAAPATTAAVAGVKLGLSAKVVVGLAVAVTATGVGVTHVRGARRAREESAVSAPARPTPPVRQVTETVTERVPGVPAVAVVETAPTQPAVVAPSVVAPSVTVTAPTPTETAMVARSRVQPRAAMQARVLPGGTTVATAATRAVTPVVQAPTLAPEATAPATPAVAVPTVGPAQPERTEGELWQLAFAVRRSNPTQALALIREHAVRFPSHHADNHRVMEVEVLCRLGRAVEARSVAAPLLARNSEMTGTLLPEVQRCLGR